MNADVTRSPDPPLPPDGYADPYAFSYPMAVLLVGSGVIAVALSIVVVALLSLLHGPELFATFYDVTVDGDTTTYAMDLTVIVVPFLTALLVTVVGHEFVHGVVFRYYGYDVTYGAVPAMGAFYAAAFGQFQNRNELLRVCLAPLVLITAACVPLLAVPVPIVSITAAFVLILNTSGAIGDLYATWRLQRMPRETLMYDVTIRRSYVYEPLEQ
ncbi:DUF3267 domain-containing protein [Natronorubrum halophilum]|uniref:DUF3267 domain-containing protein n=1 Tax=Natronorubrum halophilum TaxID=1702106 RepID=UPI000EF6C097|nr:DUF3267 domain-containing protein [Natronorubrum halophilum]